MALTRDQRQERARKAAKARWADKSAEDRRIVGQMLRESRTEETQLNRVRTASANLGYLLIPIDQ